MTKQNIVNNGLETALGLQDNQLNLGTLYNNISPVLLSVQYRLLSDTYKSNGFAQLAVDLPVSDAFRDGGFELESATADPDELQEVYEAMVENDDIKQIKDCLRWGRLYGGGALLLNTEQKPDTPVVGESLKDKNIEFIACDRWQCAPLAGNVKLSDSFLISDSENENNQLIFDKSRLRLFTGETPPFFIRNQLNGWGTSIFEHVIPQLTQYVKANSVILELLDEAKIDILKIFGLADLLMSEGGERAVTQRVNIFAAEKNYKNMGVMDTQDDYEQKTMTFASLDKILEKIFLLICSSLRLPYSKVFGKGASGFSSGEDDLENYNANVMSAIRVPATPIVKWVAQMRACQLFGSEIDDLRVKWKPLRVLTDKEQEEVKSMKVKSVIDMIGSGILTPKQGAEKLVKENIIQLTDEEINQIDEDINPEDIQEEKQVKNGLFKWLK